MYEPTTKMIVALATARRGYGGLRTWFGAVGDLQGNPAQVAIAGHLGLRPRHTKLASGGLKSITLEEAKSTLAFIAANSLVHPRYEGAHPSILETLETAFEPLGGNLHCYSNGDWHDATRGANGVGWMPLTEATFDTGVICHNGEVGFAIWVDEED